MPTPDRGDAASGTTDGAPRRDPYAALVSEAMLQQTQVSRVIEKYESFLARFPTLADLATAEEDDVLALWSGLGYYNRARNLQRAAQHVVREHGGAVPADVEALRRLPGVGPYTAGAIASMVFNQPAPIVDGNVTRVLFRLAGKTEAPDERDSVKWTWRRARSLVEAADAPATFNEGLMELGALVCTPTGPRCETCPIARFCQAQRAGRQEEIPAPKKKAKRRTLYCAAVLATRDGEVLLEQRSTAGMWAGLWQAPTLESDAPIRSAQLRRAFPAFAKTKLRKIASFTHQTTHRQVEFTVYEADRIETNPPGAWTPWVHLARLGLGNAQRRVLACAEQAPTHLASGRA